jgi:hypothetical protein
MKKFNLLKRGAIMKVCAKKQLNIFLATIFFVLALTCYQSFAASYNVADLSPAVYGRGIIPLTPGSSTTLQNTPGEARAFVTVLALGPGTLKATFTKKDTTNDVLSMILIGYPAEPAFVPSFGITPADIAVSTAITDALGGVGVIFIITTINSTESYVSSLSLKLE